MKTFVKGYVFIGLFVLLDQVSKHFFKAIYTGVDRIAIPGLLEFSYAENRGMSFGLLEGQTWLFMLVTIFALGLFGYLFLDISFTHKKVYSFSIIFFIAGTLGNAIDRIFLQYVIDFMHFPFLDVPLSWIGLSNFYNNYADMYLSLALVLLIIDMLFLEKKRKPHAN
jgi:signal peptidase II